MSPAGAARKFNGGCPSTSLISLPETLKWSESIEKGHDELSSSTTANSIGKYSHLKLVIRGRAHRSLLTCAGDDDSSDSRRLAIENRSSLSSRLTKHSKSYRILEDSDSPTASPGHLLDVNIVSNLVMWIRDGQDRFLGSVRLDLNSSNLAILDSRGRPSVLVDTRGDPTRQKNSDNDSDTSPSNSTHQLVYRCAKSMLVMGTCRVFRTDLKPHGKSTSKVITLDFRAKEILDLVDPNGMKRRLCLASLLFLEPAMKRLKHEMKDSGVSKWYL